VLGSSETHGRSALPSVRSFPLVKASGSSATSPSLPASPPVLRPLLTSRSTSRRRPFRREARSPQVRMVVFPAQSPDLRRSPLVARVRGQLSASPGSRRLVSVAPHCLEGVLPVRRLAVSAPRFFQRRPHGRTGLPASSPCGSLEVAATSSLQDFHLFITSMLGTQRSRASRGSWVGGRAGVVLAARRAQVWWGATVLRRRRGQARCARRLTATLDPACGPRPGAGRPGRVLRGLGQARGTPRKWASC